MMSFTKVHADDVRFTEHVLFDEAAASEEDCALKCTSHEACITFTFTPMTSDGSCYGYKELMGPDHLNLTSPGAKSFSYGKARLCSQKYEGYTLQSGRCIKPMDDNLTADDATQVCFRRGGGHLIHLKTHGDWYLIGCIRDELGWTKPIWLGADDKDKEGEFRWSDGSLLQLNTFAWGHNQPNNATVDPENCLANGNNGKLYDKRCDNETWPAAVICQIDI
ncbi:C-type lectin lectoxin-Thr1-like [Littorina saxatilis]